MYNGIHFYIYWALIDERREQTRALGPALAHSSLLILPLTTLLVTWVPCCRGAEKGGEREGRGPAAYDSGNRTSRPCNVRALLFGGPSVNLYTDEQVAHRGPVFLVHCNGNTADGAVLNAFLLAYQVKVSG